MKKFILMFLTFIMMSGFVFAQETSIQSCIETYRSKATIGYNALAMAIDNGFFVCGYAFGHYSKAYASQEALSECENRRIDPSNEVNGVRRIMTHCRIFEFKQIE